MSTSKKIKELLGIPATSYEKFHDLTKNKSLEENLDYANWPESWKKIYFKGYGRLEEVVLPKPKLRNISYESVLKKRRSIRTFSSKKLSLQDISTLLFYSAGLKNAASPEEGRFYPSAGARFPLEVYFVSLKTSLPSGVYHYYLKSHSLEKIRPLTAFPYRNYFTQKWMTKVPGFVVITGMFKRSTIKYGDRGYRYLLLEAGHLAQNISLAATALNLASCEIGGFQDEQMNALLYIDGVEEATVLIVGLGKKK